MGGQSDMHRERGNAAFRTEQWAEAIEHYTRAIDETKDDVRPLGNRSACYAMLGRYAESLADAERGLAVRPRWPKGWSRKGLALFYLGRLEEAERAYLSGLELEPGNAGMKDGLKQVRDALSLGGTERERGTAAFKKGDYAAAVRHYQKALEKECARGTEEEATVRSNKSAAHAKLGQGREALQEAERCCALRPDWAKGFSRRANAHYLLKEYDKARDAYRHALKLDPDNADLAAALESCSVGERSSRGKDDGDAAFKMGDFDAAVAAYSAALETFPSDEKIWSNRSASYAKLGRFKEALDDAKKVLQLRPDWARAWSRAASAMHGLKDLETAYIYYCKGLQKCPGANELVQARYALLGDLCKWDTRLCNWRENKWYAKDAQMPNHLTRIFCTSDIHVDQHGNIGWCRQISSTKFQNDVLMVAGDCGDTMNAVKQGLRELKKKFRRVFFIPGNHDLWIRPGLEDKDYPDSICKLLAMLNVFDEIDVEMAPAEVAKGLYVVPLYAWYNYQFDEGHPQPGGLRYDKFCKWPFSDLQVWEHMLNLNRERIHRYKREHGERVFSMSHYLPRAELPTPWGVTEMAKASGCKELDWQIEAIDSDVHVYGHTHMNGDGECGPRYKKGADGLLSATGGTNNTRYVQQALDGGAHQLYCVWDKGGLGGHFVEPFD